MTVERADLLFYRALAADAKIATDPLTGKGNEIMSAMTKEYGPEKGKQVFYASKNKGTIEGVDSERAGFDSYLHDHGWGKDDIDKAFDCYMAAKDACMEHV